MTAQRGAAAAVGFHDLDWMREALTRIAEL